MRYRNNDRIEPLDRLILNIADLKKNNDTIIFFLIYYLLLFFFNFSSWQILNVFANNTFSRIIIALWQFETIALVSIGHLLINYIDGEEEAADKDIKQFRDTIGN